jgi:hypothetical protein
MFSLLAASAPKEMIDAGHPSVELIFGEDAVPEPTVMCDNRLSIREVTIIDIMDYSTKCFG